MRFFGSLFSAAALAALSCASPALAAPREAAPCEQALAAAAAAAPREIGRIERLRLGAYNVENLFLHVGKYDWVAAGVLEKKQPEQEKPRHELEGVAQAIRDIDPDVMTLAEVESLPALQRFVHEFLGDAYEPLLVEGNDTRGIDVAFLVKKDLPFDLEVETHKDELWLDPSLGGTKAVPVFSRDLPALVVREKGASRDSRPLLIAFATHYKSKRPRPHDPDSSVARQAQVDATTKILQRYWMRFGADVPIVLSGDFNGSVNVEREFTPLWQAAHLDDAFNVRLPTPGYMARVNHTFHPHDGPWHPAQMDAILVSRSLAPAVLQTKVYRYKDEDGREKPLPRTYAQRDQNPSDHFPVYADVDFQALRAIDPGAKPAREEPEPKPSP